MSNLTEILSDSSTLNLKDQTAKPLARSGEDFASLLAGQFSQPNLQITNNAISFPKTESSSFALRRNDDLRTDREHANDATPNPRSTPEDRASLSSNNNRPDPIDRTVDRGEDKRDPSQDTPTTRQESAQEADRSVESDPSSQDPERAQASSDGEKQTQSSSEQTNANKAGQPTAVNSNADESALQIAAATQANQTIDGENAPVVTDTKPVDNSNKEAAPKANIQANQDVVARAGSDTAAKLQSQTSDEVKISIEKATKSAEAALHPDSIEAELAEGENAAGQKGTQAESSSPFAHLVKKGTEAKSDNNLFPQLQTATPGPANQPALAQTAFGALANNSTIASNSSQVTAAAPIEVVSAEGTAVIGSNGSVQAKSSGPSASATAARTNLPGQTAAEQVGVQVNKAIADGKDRISIQLKPVELGQVDIKLEMNHDGRMTAVISAERQETLDLLRGDQRHLLQAMSDAGMKLDQSNLSFNLGSQNDGKDQGGNSGSGSNKGSFDLDDNTEDQTPLVAEGEDINIADDGSLNVRV